MIIQTKLDVGDPITWINHTKTNKMVKCGFCNGSGRVQGNDNTIRYCPVCNGTKLIAETNDSEDSDTVRAIMINYVSDQPENYPEGPEIVYITTTNFAIREANIVIDREAEN